MVMGFPVAITGVKVGAGGEGRSLMQRRGAAHWARRRNAENSIMGFPVAITGVKMGAHEEGRSLMQRRGGAHWARSKTRRTQSWAFRLPSRASKGAPARREKA
jgi:hypothetical protein